MTRKIAYIIVLPLAIIMSTILQISTLNKIHVLEKGTIIKTTLIKKIRQSNGIDIWYKYNGKEFNDLITSSFKYEVGDTISFYHLDAKPEIFVLTNKSIKSYYYEIVFLIFFWIVSACLLYQTIKKWNIK